MHSEGMRKRELPQIVYKLMVVAATIIWGSSFIFMKDAVQVMEPSWLIGIRFLITGAILGLLFFRRLASALRGPKAKRTLLGGAIIGACLFAAYWFQTVGLVYTTPGKNAFLTATYCVIVPFLMWFARKRRPSVFNIVAAVLCIAGVGMVSLSNGDLAIGFGDGMTLVCGLMFAVHIVATSLFSDDCDVMVLTIMQFLVAGALGCLVGAVSEPLPRMEDVSFEFLATLVYLIVFASCIAMAFQNVAVAHVSPSQVAILLSLESVFGVLFSVLFYGEHLTLVLVLGFAAIFASIMLSEAIPYRPRSSEDGDGPSLSEISDAAIAGDSASVD